MFCQCSYKARLTEREEEQVEDPSLAATGQGMCTDQRLWRHTALIQGSHCVAAAASHSFCHGVKLPMKLHLGY